MSSSPLEQPISFQDQTEYKYECAGCKGWHNNVDTESKDDPGWSCGNCEEKRPGQKQRMIDETDKKESFSMSFFEMTQLVSNKISVKPDICGKIFMLRKGWVSNREWILYLDELPKKYIQGKLQEMSLASMFNSEDMHASDWGHGYIVNENTIQICG
jgi:hypothetical protein